MAQPKFGAWEALGAVVVVVILLILVVHSTAGWDWLYGENTAEWAQVIVSALAIGAGAGGLIWQVRRAADGARSDVVRRLQVLGGAIAYMRFQVAFLRWSAEDGGTIDHELEALRQHIAHLSGVQMLDMVDWEAWHAVDLARSAAARLVERIEGSHSPPGMRYSSNVRFDAQINAAEHNLETAILSVSSALARLDAKQVEMSYTMNGRGIRITPDGQILVEDTRRRN